MHCIQVWANMPVQWEQAAWSLWDTHSNMPNHRPGQEAGTAARHRIQQTWTISRGLPLSLSPSLFLTLYHALSPPLAHSLPPTHMLPLSLSLYHALSISPSHPLSLFFSLPPFLLLPLSC